MRTLKILFYYLRQKMLRFKSRGALERHQERRALEFMRWTYAHSEFYRARIDAVGGIESWRQMPTVDKKTLIASFDAWNTVGVKLAQAHEIAIQAEKSRDFSPMIGEYTVGLSSGTSGHRGIFMVHPEEQIRYAGTVLAKALPRGLLGGLLRGERIALFLRANSNLYESVGSKRLRFKFFDLVKSHNENARALQEFNPTVIISPPSILKKLAMQLESGELKIHPDRIFSAAEVLDPIDEARISDAFRIPVHQIYQATEGFLGISCRHGTLHLNEDLMIVEREKLDADRFVPIITDFCRTTQPMIRYRLNDILVERKKPCPCGSPLLAIERIEGRMDDCLTFVSRKGGDREILPDFIRRCILFSDGLIEDYRVIQLKDRSLRISIRTSSDERAGVERSITNEFERLGESFGIVVPPLHFTGEFPKLEQTTKLRRVMKE